MAKKNGAKSSKDLGTLGNGECDSSLESIGPDPSIQDILSNRIPKTLSSLKTEDSKRTPLKSVSNSLAKGKKLAQSATGVKYSNERSRNNRKKAHDELTLKTPIDKSIKPSSKKSARKEPQKMEQPGTIEESQNIKAERIDLCSVYKKLNQIEEQIPKSDERALELFKQSEKKAVRSSVERRPLSNYTPTLRRSSMNHMITHRRFSKPDQSITVDQELSLNSKISLKNYSKTPAHKPLKEKGKEKSTPILSIEISSGNIQLENANLSSGITSNGMKPSKFNNSPDNASISTTLTGNSSSNVNKASKARTNDNKALEKNSESKVTREDQRTENRSASLERPRRKEPTHKSKNVVLNLRDCTPCDSRANSFSVDRPKSTRNGTLKTNTEDKSQNEKALGSATSELQQKHNLNLANENINPKSGDQLYERVLGVGLLQQEDLINIIVPSTKSQFRYCPKYFKPISDKRMSQLLLNISVSQLT